MLDKKFENFLYSIFFEKKIFNSNATVKDSIKNGTKIFQIGFKISKIYVENHHNCYFDQNGQNSKFDERIFANAIFHKRSVRVKILYFLHSICNVPGSSTFDFRFRLGSGSSPSRELFRDGRRGRFVVGFVAASAAGVGTDGLSLRF